MSARPKVEDREERVSFFCESCQKERAGLLKHWQLLRCVCGRFYWALQPHAGGPFVAYDWPGQVHTSQHLLTGRGA